MKPPFCFSFFVTKLVDLTSLLDEGVNEISYEVMLILISHFLKKAVCSKNF